MIESKVEAACVSCRLEIDSVEIFFCNPSRLVLSGIHFEAGDFGALPIETRAASADVLISVSRLWHRSLELLEVAIDPPDVAQRSVAKGRSRIELVGASCADSSDRSPLINKL